MITIKNNLLVLFNLKISILTITFGLVIFKGAPSISHEMWLDTTTFRQAVGDEFQISLKNGQMFEGIELSYFKNRFSEFYYINDDQKFNIESRMGDTPVAVLSSNSNGLITGVYVSTKSTITYKSMDKFADFATEKGENWAIETHLNSKFPEANFREDYYRFSKILIGVGDAKGMDQSMGLKHELIALNNPYIISPSDEFSVQLLFNGRPQKNRKITIFERNTNKTVGVRTAFTNTNGICKFTVTQGNEYLVDNVILELNNKSKNDTFWTSYWAALTFRASNEPQ
jgi:cobalt/nickel transport protein